MTGGGQLVVYELIPRVMNGGGEIGLGEGEMGDEWKRTGGK